MCIDDINFADCYPEVKETKEYEELQYILNKSFDRHGMYAKGVAMDLLVAGYGKIIELQNKCDKLVQDNKVLKRELNRYILKALSLQCKLEELNDANKEK